MNKIIFFVALTILNANLHCAQIKQEEKKGINQIIEDSKKDIDNLEAYFYQAPNEDEIKKINTQKFFSIFLQNPVMLQTLANIASGLPAPAIENTSQDYKNLIFNLVNFVGQNKINCYSVFEFNHSGWQPLILDPIRCAILTSNLGLLKLLISEGCDVNDEIDDKSPLLFTFTYVKSSFNIMKLLLEKKANPNDLKLLNNLCFALHYTVCKETYFNIFELLLDAGLDWEISLNNKTNKSLEEYVSSDSQFFQKEVFKRIQEKKQKWCNVASEVIYEIIKCNSSINKLIINLSYSNN